MNHALGLQCIFLLSGEDYEILNTQSRLWGLDALGGVGFWGVNEDCLV